MRLAATGSRTTSPLYAELEANAIIAAGTDSRVVMQNGNSLEGEIENACSSPLAESFPIGSRTVAKSNTDSVRDHFADEALERLVLHELLVDLRIVL